MTESSANIGNPSEIFAGMVMLGFFASLIIALLFLLWQQRQLPGHRQLENYFKGFVEGENRFNRWREFTSIAFLVLLLASLGFNRVLAG